LNNIVHLKVYQLNAFIVHFKNKTKILRLRSPTSDPLSPSLYRHALCVCRFSGDIPYVWL